MVVSLKTPIVLYLDYELAVALATVTAGAASSAVLKVTQVEPS